MSTDYTQWIDLVADGMVQYTGYDPRADMPTWEVTPKGREYFRRPQAEAETPRTLSQEEIALIVVVARKAIAQQKRDARRIRIRNGILFLAVVILAAVIL